MTDALKIEAARRSVEFVKGKQIVGLGTGSTAAHAIRELGKRVRQGLDITGVATSRATADLADEVGIPLTDLNNVREVDISIDGADEVDPRFCMIKGGGGALTREKLVAISSQKRIIIVDQTKLVPVLGRSFHLPVEVIPFAWQLTQARLALLGCAPYLRMSGENAFETDNENFIIDCGFGEIADPAALEAKIKLLPGVVESGLFVGLLDILITGFGDGVRVEEREKK